MAKWKLKEKKVEEEKKTKKFIPQKKGKTAEELEAIEAKKAKQAELKAKKEEEKAKREADNAKKKAEAKEKRDKIKAENAVKRAKKKKVTDKKKKERAKKREKFYSKGFGKILATVGRFFAKLGHWIAVPFVALWKLIVKGVRKFFQLDDDKAPNLVDAKKAKKEPRQLDNRQRAMRNRAIGLVAMVVVVPLVILGGFKVAGALELNSGFAGRTGETYFKEADVTKYITEQTLYKSYGKSQSQWQQYLSMYGLTAEKFREQCIQDKFQHDEMVRRACEQEEITVDDATVDQHVANFRAKYDTDANYKKALENAGYTEETYWDNVKQTLLEKSLIEKEIHVDTPSDDDVKTYLSSSSSSYKDARQSSHILFNSKDTAAAQNVLNQINAGTLTFEAAVAQYSIDETTKANGGDRGWDKIESFSVTYNNGLSGLSAGEVNKELVTDAQGIHIIKCTAKWDTPETIESLEGVPQAIIEECRTKKLESNQATELKTWLETFASDNGIENEIFPMPNGLPYYVEVSASSSSAATSAATTTTSTE